jgi:hypothetical protein
MLRGHVNIFACALLFGCSAEAPVYRQSPFDDSGIAGPTSVVKSVDASPIETGPIDDRSRVNEAGSDESAPPIVAVDATVDASVPRCGDGKSDDADGDGFTTRDGDCDDCLKTVNPGAYDIPGNGVDEDCDDKAADPAECDQGLAMDSRAAEDAARAIGLCTFTTAKSRAWGVISARYTDASGTGKFSDPRAAGLLPRFGAAQPRSGKTLLALSSGVARAVDQPGFTAGCDAFDSMDTCASGTTDCVVGPGKPPAGYPKDSSVCMQAGRGIFASDIMQIYNQAALELKIRVPSNAKAFAFESIFYTHEYPEWICEIFNDFFVVFKDPKPAQAADGNIVFDANRDPIGVNTGLLAVCDSSVQSRQAIKTFTCDQGTALLRGTGYGRGESDCGSFTDSGGASTGWLKTTAPVKPGEVITLRFAIWDTTDALLDSTVLLDHFQWITFEADPEKSTPEVPPEVPVETKPVIIY